MSAKSQKSDNNTSSQSGQQSIADKACHGVGNLIKLLPTGTVFLFQFLSPVLSNNGQCSTLNKYLIGALLFCCGFSCCFASFTESYEGSDGRIYYGVATKNGLWSFSDDNARSKDLSKYKLRLGDFVHAFLALIVFAVIALMDPNTVSCYYPSLNSDKKTLLMSFPSAVGVLCGTAFMVFPNKRHGIGYPSSKASDDS